MTRIRLLRPARVAGADRAAGWVGVTTFGHALALVADGAAEAIDDAAADRVMSAGRAG